MARVRLNQDYGPFSKGAVINLVAGELDRILASNIGKLDVPEQAAEVPAGEKPVSRMNRDELVAHAEGLGIAVPQDATKKDILKLIEDASAS